MQAPLTYVTIWLCGLCGLLSWGLVGLPKAERTRQGLWTVGWFLLLVHILVAIVEVHQGSWALAVEHTARRTAELTGWNWGGGIYWNLLAGLAWGLDVGLMWGTGSRERHPRAVIHSRRMIGGFLFFMWFNATVVFTTDAGRLRCLLALIIVGGLRYVWGRRPDEFSL